MNELAQPMRLLNGRQQVAVVVPDMDHAGMFRVLSTHGLSDMANLARAKDAARVKNSRPESPASRFKWEAY